MAKPMLSAGDIELMLDDGTLESLTRADLERMDFDPPKERCALVSFVAEHVDAYGEVHAPCWRIQMAGDTNRWRELHTWGVLLFGDPPWRRSQVVRVAGRLGSLEAAVAALPVPGVDFVYSFVVEEETKRTGLAAAERRLPAAKSFQSYVEGPRQRASRWRRASTFGDEPKPKAKPSRQGELF